LNDHLRHLSGYPACNFVVCKAARSQYPPHIIPILLFFGLTLIEAWKDSRSPREWWCDFGTHPSNVLLDLLSLRGLLLSSIVCLGFLCHWYMAILRCQSAAPV